MSNLVLELRPGEMIIINGAPIRFRTKSKIELTEHVRFLFGKQIMLAENVNTPEKRVYFAIQQIYVGDQNKLAEFWNEFELAIAEVKNNGKYNETIDSIVLHLENKNYYQALRLARNLVKSNNLLVKNEKPKGHNCKFSSNIGNNITAGKGKLDDMGNWEFPCDECVAWAKRAVDERRANLACE